MEKMEGLKSITEDLGYISGVGYSFVVFLVPNF